MKTVSKKLILKKEAISNLNEQQLLEVNGGRLDAPFIDRPAPSNFAACNTGVIDVDGLDY